MKKILPLCLLLLSALPAATQESPFSLQDCIDLAREQNLQYLNEYQNLANSRAQLQQARAPFELQAEANLSVPDFSEFRDTQENVALQTRVREESTTSTYTGDLQVSQRVPYLGRFSATTSAQRKDFSSNWRRDYLDIYGDLRFNYSQELLHSPREEIVLKQAELGFTSAQFNYDRQQLQLEGQVIDAYYDLVQSIRRLEIEEQRLEQSRANLELAQRKFEIGLIAEVEALRLQVDMLNAEASYDRAKTQIERHRDSLREILGMDLDAPFEVVTQVDYREYEIDPARALEVGLRQRTDMQQAEILEEIRQLGLENTQRRNSVNATVNAFLSLRGRGDGIGDISRNLERNLWGVGIQVNLPLLDNGQRRGEIHQAQIALEQSRLSREIRRRGIVQQIKNAVRNLGEAERQISLRQAALEVADRTYEVEKSRFELGLAQSKDLLDAQADLTQARIVALEAIITYQTQLKDLRLATMANLDRLTAAGAE